MSTQVSKKVKEVLTNVSKTAIDDSMMEQLALMSKGKKIIKKQVIKNEHLNSDL